MVCWMAFCLGIIVLATVPAEARGEYRLGGLDGNPWQAALSSEGAGRYMVFDRAGNQLAPVAVLPTPFGAGTDTLIDFAGTSMKARYIDPGVNLVLADPEATKSRIPLPYTGGEASIAVSGSWGCLHSSQQVPVLLRMFDGDPATAQFRPCTLDGNGRRGRACSYQDASVVDFGADVPINRIRFYPRLGTEDDVTLIETLEAPHPLFESFSRESFADNFLAWYEIRVGDGSIPYQNGPCGRVPGRRWVDRNDPWLRVLKSTRESLDEVVDLRFPTEAIRYISFQPYPMRDWEVAEFEVFGQGYVPRTVYLTQILDFGKPVTWGKVRWSANVPEGARIEIRTRTGHTPDPLLYFQESLNGDLEEISHTDYDAIEVMAQLPPRYDVSNWSFWSSPYDMQIGLRDSSQTADAWKDGTPLLSPGPSRYLQVYVRLFATFEATPRLDQFSLQFGQAPSAKDLVGEVWPVKVESFDPVSFTYTVRPVFEPSDIGFDRLEILTHIQASEIRSVSLDGESVDLDQFVPEIRPDLLVVSFPALKGEADSFKQIEVMFDASVLRFGTEFSGWVFNSADPDRIRQGVQPGNATYRFAGDVLSVQTPVGGGLLQNVEITPNPFTPNDDGINDQLTLSYKLREVSSDRPVRTRIFDLLGRVVVELEPVVAQSGVYQKMWNGRDADGVLVSPGIYAYQLVLEVETEEIHTGLFVLAY